MMSDEATTLPWAQRAVAYQVCLPSFADGNGDGRGDLDGLRRRAGYLSALGVDTVSVDPAPAPDDEALGEATRALATRGVELVTTPVADLVRDGFALVETGALEMAWSPKALLSCIESAESIAEGQWPLWSFSGATNPRARSRFGDRESRARIALVLLLSLRGTPLLYQGEELALADAADDPGGLGPIPWLRGTRHGWGPGARAPFGPLASVRSVEWQEGDPLSVLRMVRGAIEFRRESPALQEGTLELLDTPEEILGYRRRHGDDVLEVYVNFADVPVEYAPVTGTVVVVSDGVGRFDRIEGVLRREQAVVIRPDRVV